MLLRAAVARLLWLRRSLLIPRLIALLRRIGSVRVAIGRVGLRLRRGGGRFLHRLGRGRFLALIEKIVINRTHLPLQRAEKITGCHAVCPPAVYRNNAEPTRTIVAPFRAARS